MSEPPRAGSNSTAMESLERMIAVRRAPASSAGSVEPATAWVTASGCAVCAAQLSTPSAAAPNVVTR